VVLGVAIDAQDAPAGGGRGADADEDVGVLMVTPLFDGGQWVVFDGFPVGFVVAAGRVGIDSVPPVGEKIGQALARLGVG
jgi:hypothetical protein